MDREPETPDKPQPNRIGSVGFLLLCKYCFGSKCFISLGSRGIFQMCVHMFIA